MNKSVMKFCAKINTENLITKNRDGVFTVIRVLGTIYWVIIVLY
ncbi:hypothetical protein [Draconibacterium halophilum]|nr:hypothetical protein [Draconibacterium halophilum]